MTDKYTDVWPSWLLPKRGCELLELYRGILFSKFALRTCQLPFTTSDMMPRRIIHL
jgi:hypothetical protein